MFYCHLQILELCTTVDSPATRLSNTDKIIESVIEAQQVAIVCAGLQKSGSAGREILLEVGKGDDEEAKYSINIVDRQKVIEGNGVVTSYAAFIIPQGRLGQLFETFHSNSNKSCTS